MESRLVLFIDLNETPDSTPLSSPSPPPPPPPPVLQQQQQQQQQQLEPITALPAPHVGPSDAAYALACAFHVSACGPTGDERKPPANHPGEAGVGLIPPHCGACGRPEIRGSTVVCDRCERGFHLSCAGVIRLPRNNVSAANAEWLCGDCGRTGGAPRKRWQLGPVRLPDINAPPPSVGPVRLPDINAPPPPGLEDREDFDSGIEDAENFRKNYTDGHFSSLATQLQLPLVSNLKSGLCPGSSASNMSMCYSPSVILQNGLATNETSKNATFSSSYRGTFNINSNATTSSEQLQGEINLQSLRNYVMERGGSLDEGWHVELKENSNRWDPYAVYCSPDGKMFESIFDVAQYLGIRLCARSADNDERNDGSCLAQRSLPQRRRKKDLARMSMANISMGNLDHVWEAYIRQYSGAGEAVESQHCKVLSGSGVESSIHQVNGNHYSHNLPVGLPVQYEDFFVTSFGRVDNRTTYHDKTQIWPIGFKSSWHDRFTGSFFECEVADGGDSGPIFKVRRSSCSLFPIPKGVTIISHNKHRGDVRESVASCSMVADTCNDEDDSVLMLLSDPNPSEQNLSSCFSQEFGAVSLNSFLTTSECVETSQNRTEVRDEIGEFYVEGRSSSSAWRMVSITLADRCYQVYKHSGILHFCCRHGNDVSSSFPGNGLESLDLLGPLARFCSVFGPKSTPKVVHSEKELEDACIPLVKWLEHDRFGLNLDFVQEIIEKLPGSRGCSQYLLLKDRADFPTPWTVASGLLVALQKNGEAGGREVGPYDLQLNKKQPGLQPHETTVGAKQPPPGQAFSSKLPAELVGDAVQIWELIWRFYDVLGLSEPISFEDLEKELTDPWPCGSSIVEGFDKDQNPQGQSNGLTPLSCGNQMTAGEDSFTFIRNGTGPSNDALQAKVASETYRRCTGIALTKVHTALLKVLVSELLFKVSLYVDPNSDAKEVKSRRGRKKDVESALPLREVKIGLLTTNELTWPELARRYILAVSFLYGSMDSSEVYIRQAVKMFRCLHGDGGVLCGSIAGIAGMEADALLLAEAEKLISGSTKQEKKIFAMDLRDSEVMVAREPVPVNHNTLPEWAQVLEPVRKLPTNVGTRIRRCVYEALDKKPPEWARKRLEYSISKEVYKGNASGPTKKAVLSVLAEAASANVQHQPQKVEKVKEFYSIPDIIMKRCRILLRIAISTDEAKVFGILLASTLLNCNDNEDEGMLGSPAMVSRPLDFRTIDIRLAVGAYCGSHEAFLEDAREVLRNIRMAYGDQPDLLQLAETLSQNFEELFEKEVVNLVKMIKELVDAEGSDAEAQRKLRDVLLCTEEIPKAPWEDGLCKVCGIDRDDDSVLLCDTCDSEYHTYCLNPPLGRIPEGNWYCPSCAAGKHKTQDIKNRTEFTKHYKKRNLGVESCAFKQTLNHLVMFMEERDYWEYSVEERIILLKFLCDEVLSTSLVREHLEQSAEKSSDLHQKLRSLVMEWRNLKFKEELFTLKKGREAIAESSGISDLATEEGALLSSANPITSAVEHNNVSSKLNSSTSFLEYQSQGVATALKVVDDAAHFNISYKDAVPVINDSKEDDSKKQEHVLSLKEPSGETMEENSFADVRSTPEKFDTSNTIDGCCSFSEHSPVEVPGGSGVTPDSTAPIQKNELSEQMSLDELPHVQGLTSQDHQVPNAKTADSEDNNTEFSSVKHEIMQLQDSIAIVASKLMSSSLRREFMGRDSYGRMYWIVGRPGKRPWLLVNGAVPLERSKLFKEFDLPFHCTTDSASTSSVLGGHVLPIGSDSYGPRDVDLYDNFSSLSSWVVYESDHEIQEVVSWLRDNDPREKELKETTLQWLRMGFRQGNVSTTDDQLQSESSINEKHAPSQCLATKAEMFLSEKHGPLLETDLNDMQKKCGKKLTVSHAEKIHRCNCLEPVWPSRHHCFSCHQTFSTITELEKHNEGKVVSCDPTGDEGKENDDSQKGKWSRLDSTKDKEQFDEVDTVESSKDWKSDCSSTVMCFQRRTCPYDLDEISRKFTPTSSNKQLVQEVGLIGSNGVPLLISNTQTNFFDPCLELNDIKKYDSGPIAAPTTAEPEPSASQWIKMAVGDDCKNVNVHTTKSQQTSLAHSNNEILLENVIATTEGSSFAKDKISGKGVDCKYSSQMYSNCSIPESSYRPLLGKNSQILRRLKINLLDMDAALPDEAVKPSHVMKRGPWRAFVKFAETIHEMVQATILFESMIKTEFLTTSWWYWSSLTAAAKTSTLSSLSLRIYTLDDCIIYKKTAETARELTEILKPVAKSGRKRKDMES